VAPTISNQLNLFAFLPGLNLGATLQALEQRQLAEFLRSPISLRERQEASFLAGGEYPYPQVQGSSSAVGGAVTI